MRLMLNTEEALTRFGGDSDLYKELAQMFLDQEQYTNEKLLDLTNNNKLLEAASSVHMLKGLSGTLGAECLYDACIALEVVLKGTKEDNINELTTEVTTLFDKTKEVVKAYLANN